MDVTEDQFVAAAWQTGINNDRARDIYQSAAAAGYDWSAADRESVVPFFNAKGLYDEKVGHVADILGMADVSTPVG